jgi:hypothetical protein
MVVTHSLTKHHALFGGLLLLLLQLLLARAVMGLSSEGECCCSNLGKAMLHKLMR